ncbi:branched-chain amino acid transport system II carrier protein [Pantoea sp. FN0302]|uniref:branched-chain amino acid transport system II carrier protein n=1 Tax=unclassified Pantoea TaxID=2630326 RepID=UPI003CF109DB
MRKQFLPTSDVIALSFMTLALFLGAGNIIYPPIVGKMTSEYYLISSIGFNISGVLLPMLAVPYDRVTGMGKHRVQHLHRRIQTPGLYCHPAGYAAARQRITGLDPADRACGATTTAKRQNLKKSNRRLQLTA